MKVTENIDHIVTRRTLVEETFALVDLHNGICVVDGHGLDIRVDKGHLIIKDGIGEHRRERRYSRIGHGLTRLAAIGHHGTITLDALRWMDRTGIFFAHLDSDGQLLTANAHYGLNDARLRRAQALAYATPTAVAIMQTILHAKLEGHARIAGNQLDAPETYERIMALHATIQHAQTINALREIERSAALEYWNLWPPRIQLKWATKDLPRIPEHWTRYRSRRSQIAKGSPTSATNPINALLNYCNALAAVECRRACLILGLDPGLGFLHEDTHLRDSLAFDLIETIRPDIETYILDLTDRHTFRYKDFHENENGHVRILAPLTHRLTETLPKWAALIAPHAETITHQLAESSPRTITKKTPLTNNKLKTASKQGAATRRKNIDINDTKTTAATTRKRNPKPFNAVCKDCGTTLKRNDQNYCNTCYPQHNAASAAKGRATLAKINATPEGKQARSQAISTGRARIKDQLAIQHGHTPDTWQTTIYPHIQTLSNQQIADLVRVTPQYASKIKRGVQIPHPRHWATLLADYRVTAPLRVDSVRRVSLPHAGHTRQTA